MKPHVYPPGCYFHSLADIAGKRITVMGIGLNGGGEEAIRFFLKNGARVTACDTKTADDLAPSLRRLRADLRCAEKNGTLRLVLGAPHIMEDFTTADVVIKNPGVNYAKSAFLQAAAVIETDLSVFLALARPRNVIAVTGSKGKSTTTRAIYDGLVAAGRTAFLAGNIGRSPLTYFDLATEPEFVVLELSSWQLADLRGRGLLKPHIAVMTPIFRDHQNWYENSMEAYVADKKLIYADQTADDYLFCEADNAWGSVFAAEERARVIRYGSPPGNAFPSIPGVAKQNVALACRVLGVLGISADECQKIFAHWGGLPHRMEFFHAWRSAAGTTVKFYNDSAATVPEAAAAALRSFEKSVHFIAGGTDKELDFAPFAAALAATPPVSLSLIDGTATRDKILPLLQRTGTPYYGPFDNLTPLLDNLKTNLSSARADSVVIFSPGATSFGLFANEFDRGDRFKAAVRAIFP